MFFIIRPRKLQSKDLMSTEDLNLFHEAIKGARKIKHDTIAPQTLKSKKKKKEQQQLLDSSRKQDNEFYFSDLYEPHLPEEGPIHFTRKDVSKYEMKRLRRGVYVPDIFLDLHGMTQLEAKKELAALIQLCLKEHISCACVIHGLGKNILRKKTPCWLAQHPSIMAFHQAPLEFGGDGALLVLFEIPER